MSGKASKLIQDLNNVPSIVGGLGLSIAAAQRQLNLDYLESIERLLALTKATLGERKEGGIDIEGAEKTRLEQFRELLQDVLKSTAPSRYQFTETTLAVRLDLAQSMDLGASAKLGIGFGALAVNAGMTLGYGYDYQAAAEVRTVLHAHTLDPKVQDTLMKRAKDLNDKALAVPERTDTEKSIEAATKRIAESATGITPPGVETAPAVATRIDDQALKVGSPFTQELTDVFAAGEGDMTYSAATSDAAVCEALVKDKTSVLELTPKTAGPADITVTAKDSEGAEAKTEFKVTVTV